MTLYFFSSSTYNILKLPFIKNLKWNFHNISYFAKNSFLKIEYFANAPLTP